MNTKAMHKISYGLFILSAQRGQQDNACIINTVLQVTSDPNRIIVTMNKHDFTHDMVVDSGLFTLSVLSVDAPFSIFQRFGMQSGRNVDKFKGFSGAWRAQNGLYLIPEHANAYICGKVMQTMDAGTHTIFVADVTDCDVLNEKESVTYAYYQQNIKPAQQKSQVKGWICTVCGYRYEGEILPPDFICPICYHGAQDFERET